ncbi:MAG: hypothetical protein ABMB14_14640 [Myxococcota bacterium]
MNQQLALIWVSVLSTQGVFGALIAFLPAGTSTEPLLWLSFALPALFTAGMSLAWGRVISPNVAGNGRWVVRWAMGEAVSLMGLTAHLVAGATGIAAVLVGLGFLLVLAQFPREGG